MEKNSETQVNLWVEDRLAALTPDAEWKPDLTSAWSRLRQQHAGRSRKIRHWMIWAAATAACICLMALPSPRVFAEYCLNCSVAFWQSLSTSAPTGAGVKPEKSRRIAPDFTLPDAAGRPLRLSDFRGKVVLLNFWATWCGGCQVEIPWFIEFERQYKDSGLVVIGVSMDDDGWESVKPYVEEKRVNYAIVIGNADLRKLYKLGSMPMTLMIDQTGRIASTHVGLVSKSDYKFEIETLLSKKAVGKPL